jgi:hypothetical protein
VVLRNAKTLQPRSKPSFYALQLSFRRPKIIEPFDFRVFVASKILHAMALVEHVLPRGRSRPEPFTTVEAFIMFVDYGVETSE